MEVVTQVARADVAVRQTTDAVQQLNVAKFAFVEDLFDRKWRGDEIERIERAPGARHLCRLVVAPPQVLGEVGHELVRDDELRRG